MSSRTAVACALPFLTMVAVGCGGGGGPADDASQVVPQGFRVESATPAAQRVLRFTLPGTALTCTAFFGTDLTLVRWTSSLPPLAALSPIATAARENNSLHAIYLVAPDGSWLRRLTVEEDVRSLHPSWSPDGTHMSFTRIGDSADIWTMNAAGGDFRRLTNTSGRSDASAWSPDGSSVAFKEGTLHGAFDIYRISVRGRTRVQLTNNPYEDRGAEWSPDGIRMVYLSDRSGDYEIYTMDAADGGNRRRLTRAPGEDRAPAWSPDGRRILFVSDRNGNPDLYVMDVDGANVQQLTNGPGRSGHPDWSPDGSMICYRYAEDTGRELRVMNADGSGVRAVLGPPYEVNCLAWLCRRSRRVVVGGPGGDAGFDPPLGDRVQAVVLIHDERSIRSAVGIIPRGGARVRFLRPTEGETPAVEVGSARPLKVVESVWMGQPAAPHLQYSAGAKKCRITFDATTGRVARVTAGQTAAESPR